MMNFVQRNGIRLAYVESGGGPKSMLLVHGWGCDHTALAPQMDYFRTTYRVVAVDLRGHGASDAPYEEYTVPGFADDLAYPPTMPCGNRPCLRLCAAFPSMSSNPHSEITL
jgi:pimeloyl-ACP methyl ester carboxylesterase